MSHARRVAIIAAVWVVGSPAPLLRAVGRCSWTPQPVRLAAAYGLLTIAEATLGIIDWGLARGWVH